MVELTNNAKVVLQKRYLKKNNEGEVVEEPEDLFHRVAKNVASAETIFNKKIEGKEKAIEMEEVFYEMMSQLNFLPNSPCLMNAGRNLQQLSACFVLPIEDSMESIFDAVRNSAMIHKSGGGTGFSFSKLRPKNDFVSTTYGLSSGPISFMKVFDAATHAVNQGGFRRGANMGVMHITHPDIEEFISCKSNTSEITNFNISVAITDEFMQAVQNKTTFELLNPRNGRAVKTINANELFNKIAKQAWATGEPGILFIDEINKYNPLKDEYEIIATNPCGELPLESYGACVLGSINLSKFVKNNKIDRQQLKKVIQNATRFLDNVIEVNAYPLDEIEKTVKKSRKIGLGIMGFSDMLFQLGIKYDSQEGINEAEKIMSFIKNEAEKASIELAKERGPFPLFDKSVYKNGSPRRNATCITCAPTGSISMIAGCSSGIEPIYSIAYYKNVMDGEKLPEVHAIFKDIAIEKGFNNGNIFERAAETGTIQDIVGIPDDIKNIFVAAMDISPEWHVRMQAAFQKHVDNSISKTINMPENATVEDVQNAYKLAYELKCKGITVYRDGSRENQVLSLEKKEVQKVSKERIRPKKIHGETVKMETGCGPLYVTVNYDEQGPYEIFNTMGKAGGCPASQCEAIGRLVSLCWKTNGDTNDIIKSLRGISCHRPMGFGNNKCTSCADAIAKAISLCINNNEGDIEIAQAGEACPDCGGIVVHNNGCIHCRDCGYSKCS